jgi:hypothetical protein
VRCSPFMTALPVNKPILTSYVHKDSVFGDAHLATSGIGADRALISTCQLGSCRRATDRIISILMNIVVIRFWFGQSDLGLGLANLFPRSYYLTSSKPRSRLRPVCVTFLRARCRCRLDPLPLRLPCSRPRLRPSGPALGARVGVSLSPLGRSLEGLTGLQTPSQSRHCPSIALRTHLNGPGNASRRPWTCFWSPWTIRGPWRSSGRQSSTWLLQSVTPPLRIF